MNQGLVHHFYADDSQLYISFKPTDNVAQFKDTITLGKLNKKSKKVKIYFFLQKLAFSENPGPLA